MIYISNKIKSTSVCQIGPLLMTDIEMWHLTALSIHPVNFSNHIFFFKFQIEILAYENNINSNFTSTQLALQVLNWIILSSCTWDIMIGQNNYCNFFKQNFPAAVHWIHLQLNKLYKTSVIGLLCNQEEILIPHLVSYTHTITWQLRK